LLNGRGKKERRVREVPVLCRKRWGKTKKRENRPQFASLIFGEKKKEKKKSHSVSHSSTHSRKGGGKETRLQKKKGRLQCCIVALYSTMSVIGRGKEKKEKGGARTLILKTG